MRPLITRYRNRCASWTTILSVSASIRPSASQPPGQLRQQVAGLSPWGVSEPPRCLLLAHSNVQQLGDGTPDSVGCRVVAVHIEQRRDVARPQPFSLPHLVVRACQRRDRISRWCRQAGPLSPARECRCRTANRDAGNGDGLVSLGGRKRKALSMNASPGQEQVGAACPVSALRLPALACRMRTRRTRAWNGSTRRPDLHSIRRGRY